MKLHQNTILITGGSSGIGLALAKKFVELNNQVIILGRDAHKLEKAKDQLPGLITYVCDLNQDQAIEALVHQLKQSYPSLNILINNAGLQYRYFFTEADGHLSQITEEIQVNLQAPIKLTSLCLSILKNHKEAAIVNISSGLALAPKPKAAVYCASKAGVHMFTQALRYQLEKTSIKVFEVFPPRVDTPMNEAQSGKKLSPEKLVDEFIKNFEKDKWETYVGVVKLFKIALRIAPGIARRFLKSRP